MADKTLRIIFNGISTLWPGPPRNGDKPPHKAFVMMAANVEKKSVNEWDITIPDHFPFVCVDPAVLENPPKPQARTGPRKDGDFIYFLGNARVTIAPGPKRGTPIKYFSDPEKPLADRPGSKDVAPADDIRWLADIRDILSKPAPLKKTVDPAASVGDEVAVVVNLDGGELRSNFPCASVHPKTFRDAKGKQVTGLKRVLADEFLIDIPYPTEIDRITLWFRELRKGKPLTGPKKLVLKWPEGKTTLEVRMGNDPKDEVLRLNTPQRCDPVRKTAPVLKPRDDDFDLHYNFLEMDGVGRPLPQNDIHQCDFEGCKPATI